LFISSPSGFGFSSDELKHVINQTFRFLSLNRTARSGGENQAAILVCEAEALPIFTFPEREYGTSDE
jgi:hypothetical protein